jgi:regulation of enolase protein 1 (concanavalin A-like superfamily)
MEWLNEPANWQRTGEVVTVSVDPGTDFWRETGYGYVRDSGHVYGEVLGGDLDVSVRVHCTLGVQYDQAGVMLRADERTWLKTGMEFFEGRPRLSTVLTLGRSSWMVTDLPAGTDDIVLRVSRRGDAVEVRYVLGDGQPELAALAFLPPGREVLAGVMGAAPEGPGFRVTFQELRITEPDWSGSADDNAVTWQDDQHRWAGAGTPGWSSAEGEPGWAAPEAGAEATDWPGTAAEEDGPGWTDPAGEEDEAGWPVPADAADEPGWAAPADAAEEPFWAAAAAEDAAQSDRALAGEPAPDGPAAPDRTRPDLVTADAAGPDPAAPESAGRAPGSESADGEPGRPDPPRPEVRNRGTGPAAPVRGSEPDWATGADRDPAEDWDLLAAGAQAGPAERWTAQPDADVANEWPGPPLRPAAGNEPPARDAMPPPAVDDPADDAETDPGLTQRPAEDAATFPDQTEASTEPDPPAATGEGAAADGTTEDAATEDRATEDRATEDGAAADGTTEDAAAADGAAADGSAADGGAEPAPAKSKPSVRESRRARSKRAAVDPPAEPDAADEWISLLTADPVDE